MVKSGYQIRFKERSPLSREPIFFQQSARPQLEEEVASFLSKGAVEQIVPINPGFYSRIFLVPKKNGKLSLIIDLSNLIHYVYIQSFRMETQRKVRNAISQNDWAFSVDLTDGYLHVPIHPRSRKFLCFTLKGKVFQFIALPFGLSTSPYVFTSLMNVIAIFLRKRAIILHPYLDDWLARNQSLSLLLEHRHFIMSLINSLGLDNQLREVRSDSNSEFHLYRDGISDKSQHCQSSSSKSPETSPVNSGLLTKETSISQSFPVSLGTNQCGSRLCNARQITSPTITNVFVRPVVTPDTAVTSPNQGDQRYCVSPELVETGVHFQQG